MKIIKQKQINPRKMWPNEAVDFTPWIADNIEEISEKIGMELEVVGQEVSVGPYSADILAKDVNTEEYVVIENQLEKTNHDHLGKSITYASVLNAKTIIWVATIFTEEHKKALDWLNDNTTDELSFFGIQVELWQIEDDTASVRFNIVSQPSSNVKTIRKKSKIESESTNIQYDFWTRFKEMLQDTKHISKLQEAKPRYWFDIAIGRSNIHISNFCNTWNKSVGVRLYIRNTVVDTYYPKLLARKTEIEKALNLPLAWDANPAAKDKTIAIQTSIDFNDKNSVDEALKWMVETTLKFYDVFTKEVKAI